MEEDPLHLGQASHPMNDVTRLLSAIEQGDPQASEQLLPLVYDELRKLAARRLAREKPGQTLQATALVHEAYLRLVAGEGVRAWSSQAHFFAAAAEAMRRIIIDRARDRRRLKRGGEGRRVDLDLGLLPDETPIDDLLALDEALQRLERDDPVSANLVKLRFFAGLGQGEAAEALGLPRRTADRHWAFARAWLYDRLRREP
jgi:RNA polymerase sigma factor (TIGR02999 family)